MLGEHTLKEESPFSPSRVKYGYHFSLNAVSLLTFF